MRRLIVGLAVLAAVPNLSLAADPAPAPAQPMVIQSYPATTVDSAQSAAYPMKHGRPLPPGAIPAPPPYPVKHETLRTKFLAWRAYHNHEPDGVPTPVGPSSLYTEFKYAFGSARQFFGTAEAAEGHLRGTYVPGPNRYGP